MPDRIRFSTRLAASKLTQDQEIAAFILLQDRDDNVHNCRQERRSKESDLTSATLTGSIGITGHYLGSSINSRIRQWNSQLELTKVCGELSVFRQSPNPVSGRVQRVVANSRKAHSALWLAQRRLVWPLPKTIYQETEPQSSKWSRFPPAFHP